MVEGDLGVLDVEYCCANNVKIGDFVVVECQVLESLKFKDNRMRKAQFRDIGIKKADDHFGAFRRFLFLRRVCPFAPFCRTGNVPHRFWSSTARGQNVKNFQVIIEQTSFLPLKLHKFAGIPDHYFTHKLGNCGLGSRQKKKTNQHPRINILASTSSHQHPRIKLLTTNAIYLLPTALSSS